MKRSTWTILLNVLIGAGCIACLSYLSRRKAEEQKTEEKLDEALEESFPASDPLPY